MPKAWFFIIDLESSKISIPPFDQKYLSESTPHLVDYFLGTALLFS